jgi:uncharacterized membrane protein YdfJ with MMPL/SSD domain
MAQRSGAGPQIYEIGGNGVVLWMPAGSVFPAAEADAKDYNALSWDASVTETDQDATNTSDYNTTTHLMNQRSLTTARRIRGTANYHFNADPLKDLLKEYLTTATVYPAMVLFVTRGNLAGTGITATNRCYLLLPEVKLGEIAIQGADPTALRGVSIPFMSNGIWSYVSEAIPTG